MSYFLDDVVDLTKDSSDEDLAASKQGLAIVASNDPSVFERREKLWDQRIHSFRNPRINPAYQVTGQPGEWTLARHASERYFKTVSSSERVCLPDSCKVRARSLDASGLAELQRCDRSQFAELARALVVLDLPERFMPAVATQQ